MRRRRQLGWNTAGLSGWSPLQLGASLFAWWDAERADLITHVGGAVSSWADVVAGLTVDQAVAGSKPTYSATSFNGRSGVTFDGTADELTRTTIGNLPTGASPSWIISVVSQDALAADTTVRSAMMWGDISTANGERRLRRNVVGGVNRALTDVGNGAAVVGSTNTSVDFSGRHIVIGKVSSTDVQTDVDGVAGPSAAVVPATSGNNALSIGSAFGGGFFNGIFNTLMVTAALSAANETLLLAYLNRRL